ncbi:chromosome segregation protein SMC [Halobacteriales archaeon SW_7_68_16]|nr:MAG: chromosome segregation protein SMC [Halobacteriales archaeon SW_7_68_16]
MHITELVLDDFKSFGRKTRIPFYEDFTTISGPNGSGKSNIIDAVLFALGLARTRGIRAEKLTDLIYNPGHADGDGTAGPNEASVEVVLDNADRTLSRSQVVSAAGSEDVGDVDTITVKRRVKRTEDNYYSYYYLNGRSVNLSDIQDLLATAGIAPEGYNVVMQGDVTEIISMTPHERREIIDEIAGVAGFDAKKEDAFEELDTVEERIDEADLRVEEKETRLDQLADERETALEYRSLKEERGEYEGYRKAAELEDKRGDLEAIEAEIEATETTVEDRRHDLDEAQGRVDRLEDDLAELNAEIERTGEDEQLAIKGEIEELKAEIGRLEDDVETAEAEIEATAADRREAFVEIDRKNERVDELDEKIKERKVKKASLKREVGELEDDLAAVEAEIDAVDAEYDELKATLAEKKEAIEAEKGERNDRQRDLDRLTDEARRRSREIDEAEADRDEAEERLPEIDDRIADLEDELEKAEHNHESISSVVEDLKDERAALREEVDEIEDDLDAAKQEYAEAEAATGSDGSSYGRAVSAILNGDLGGVHGTVAQLGGVSEQYATACETAAGGRLANVVVDDDGVGERCIEYLKSRNAGRATFLPLTEMHRRSLPSAPDVPGVVGFAYDLVDFDEEYAGVFSYVLGDTLVVEDMATARDLMGEFRMVTVDGDLVEKSGAMTGGSSSGSRYSFGRSGPGRIERLADRITELQDERDAVREELRDVEERLADARDRKSNVADEVRAIGSEIEDAEADRETVEDRIDDLDAEIAELEAERESVRDEADGIESEIDAHGERIADLEAEIADVEAELADSDLPELTDRVEGIESEIAERGDRIDDIDNELNELRLEREYAEDAIDELHDEVEAAQNRKAEAEDRIDDLETEIEDREATLAEKREVIAELEAELAELKEDREALREDLRGARDERDEAKSAVETVEGDLADLREREDEVAWEIDQLAAEVGDYDPEAIPDHDDLRAEIERVEEEMAALEPVNMLAIDEYDEVEADLADLREGRETLVEERDGIRERIESYEERKRETFMNAYESIDAHFRDVFERLSSGTGSLHLEDEDDPFDGGLTMKAQPGDKPIQRLDAMSGGEKSLTALSFIFAIQRHNPAPFYALDEVDAFLDAANAERVGEMVDALADDAQFVVVTHRSAMLDRSDRAIGVTMGEDNVSAVTGIALADDGADDDDTDDAPGGDGSGGAGGDEPDRAVEEVEADD